MDVSDTSPLRKKQRALLVSLALVGIGNLILPAEFKNLLPIDYLAVCFLVLIFSLVVNLNVALKTKELFLPVLVFALSILPGFLVSPLTDYGLSKLFAFLIFFLLIGAVSCVNNAPWMIKNMAMLLLFASFLISLLVLLDGGTDLGGRAVLWDLNPIAIGRATAISGTVCLTILLVRSSASLGLKVTLLAFTTLSFGVTINTGSRGPLLSAGLALIAVLISVALARKLKPSLLVVLSTPAVVGFVLLSGSDDAGLVRIQEGGDSGRLSLLSETWPIFLNNAMGVGWGNLGAFVTGYSSPDGRVYPHNVLAEFLVEGGLFALFGFTVLLITALRHAFSLSRFEPRYGPVVLAVLVYSIANALLSSDIVGNRLMWLMLAVTLALGATNRLTQYTPGARKAGQTTMLVDG